jgi:glycosyltransferase involved in cell wall biosynthesis
MQDRAPDVTSAMGGKVLVVYQHLPHYRRAVFHLMQRSDRYLYEFAASLKPLDPTVVPLESASIRCMHPLTNVKVGKFLWQSGLVGLLLRNRYDAVIFLGDQSYISTWIGAVVCRMRRTKVLMWTHGWSRKESGFRRVSRLTFYHLADQLLLYGDRARQLGAELGYPYQRMTVIYNSVSSRAEIISRAPNNRLEASPADSPILLCVGRLAERKRLDLLVNLAVRLRQRGTSVRLWFIGDGPARASLERSSETHDLDATFFGALYDSERVTELSTQATLTVIPGDAGLSVVQSMECGVPVITNDNSARHAPEVEAILPGVNGDFFRNNDIEHLADVVQAWLGKTESELASAGIHAQNRVVDRYSAEGQVERIEAALDGLLGTEG